MLRNIKVAVYYLPGTLVGALWGGWLGDKFGRISTIGFACLWAIVGASLQASAQNAPYMFCARVFNGIGTGILNAITPVWATETASHTSRGAFVSIEFTLNIFGVVVAYWLEYGTSFYGDGTSSFIWRFPIAFQIVPLIGLFCVIWFMPESPRWLVKEGRDQEARFILGRLRGEDADGFAEAEYQDIRNICKLENETSQQQSYISMLFGIKTGKLHTARRVQLVIWLQILQEWIGIAGITIYGPEIFTIAGIAASDRQWVSGLNNITYMLATLICVFTLDRIGRRWTLYWGAVSMVLGKRHLSCSVVSDSMPTSVVSLSCPLYEHLLTIPVVGRPRNLLLLRWRSCVRYTTCHRIFENTHWWSTWHSPTQLRCSSY